MKTEGHIKSFVSI